MGYNLRRAHGVQKQRFETVFGPLGILFATPLAVVAFVAVKKLWVRDTLGETTEVPGEP